VIPLISPGVKLPLVVRGDTVVILRMEFPGYMTGNIPDREGKIMGYKAKLRIKRPVGHTGEQKTGNLTMSVRTSLIGAVCLASLTRAKRRGR